MRPGLEKKFLAIIMNEVNSKLVVLPVVLMVLLSASVALGQADRETWQPPEKIMDAVGVKPGMVIGEPGAGTGYLTFHLSKRVGPKGKVYANDISKSSLGVIKDRAQKEGIKNIEIVMGKIDDPKFPSKKLDMVIMVYVLHMLDRPVEFMKSIKKYMKPDAPLVIIEKNTHKDRAHAPHFMTKKQVLETIQKTNYKLISTKTFLPKDTIYIFKIKK
jgi:arsenite methyltransferase